MKVYLHKIKDNRYGYGSTRGSGTDIEIDLPENHDFFKNPNFYNLENGQLILDDTYKQDFLKKREEQLNKPPLEEELASFKKQNADLTFQLMLNGVL